MKNFNFKSTKSYLSDLEVIYENYCRISYDETKYNECFHLIDSFVQILQRLEKAEYSEETWKRLQICQQRLDLYTIENNKRESMGFETAKSLMLQFIEKL